jgi:hypothetical protein
MVHPLNAKILPILLLLTLFFIGFSVSSAYATTLGIQQGSVFTYAYGRMSTFDQSYNKGNVTYHVLTFNQQELQVEISDSNYTFHYQNGFPIQADRLEALFYLPPEAIRQSTNGNLEWTRHFNTTNMGIANATSQTLNYTTQATSAGTFNCLNLTLAVTGMDSGDLSFLFDVNSGILIYEQYIPSYGDIIIQELTSAQSNQPQQSTLLLNAAVSAATLSLPVAIAVIQIRRKTQKPKLTPQNQAATAEPNARVRRSLRQQLMILAGAALSLVAVFIPWGQPGNSQAYLLISLPSLFSSSQVLPPSADTFFAVSFLANAAAIAAWACLALYMFSSKPKVAGIAAVTSAALTVAAAIVFIPAYSAASYGVMVLLIGAGILLISLLAAKKPATKANESNPPTNLDSAAESSSS